MTTTTTNGVGRRITTREALVKTVAVEIKTLTVTGKMVTQAVFRQLKEEPLLDPQTSALLGVPWGTVNYHPDKCTEDSQHVHVVWQKGDELRRARIVTAWQARYDRKEELGDAWTNCMRHAVNFVMAARAHSGVRVGSAVKTKRECVLTMKVCGWTFTRSLVRSSSTGYDHYGQRRESDEVPREIACWLLQPDAAPGRRWDRETAQNREETPEEVVERVKAERQYDWERFHELFVRYCREYGVEAEDCTVAWAEQVLATALATWEERKAAFEQDEKAWHAQWAAVNELDQLFIAV